MYGTRKEITHELKRLFAADELIAVFVWTAESVKAVLHSHYVTDAEADAVLERLGNKPMEKYQQCGVSWETVMQELTAVRSETRSLNVTADLLERLVQFAEQALQIEENIAQDDRVPIPECIVKGKAAVAKATALLNA